MGLGMAAVDCVRRAWGFMNQGSFLERTVGNHFDRIEVGVNRLFGVEPMPYGYNDSLVLRRGEHARSAQRVEEHKRAHEQDYEQGGPFFDFE